MKKKINHPYREPAKRFKPLVERVDIVEEAINNLIFMNQSLTKKCDDLINYINYLADSNISLAHKRSKKFDFIVVGIIIGLVVPTIIKLWF